MIKMFSLSIKINVIFKYNKKKLGIVLKICHLTTFYIQLNMHFFFILHNCTFLRISIFSKRNLKKNTIGTFPLRVWTRYTVTLGEKGISKPLRPMYKY